MVIDAEFYEKSTLESDFGTVIQVNGNNNITIDDELSEDSKNPVQNKVITAKINLIENDLNNVSKDFNDHKNDFDSRISEIDKLQKLQGGKIFALEEGKQDKLVLDELPAKNSTKFVNSGGVYNGLQNLNNQISDTLTYFEQYMDVKHVSKEDFGEIDKVLDGIIEIQEDLRDGNISVSDSTDVTIAEITLEEDTVSIEITSETFTDISKVKDLIITFQIAKATTKSTKPLYMRFKNADVASDNPVVAVIGNTSGGWAHDGYILKGIFYSSCVGANRMCIAPYNLGANGQIAVDLCTTINVAPVKISAITIAPSLATELIPKGSIIKIEGRVTK